jgi:serine/threonine-protein kinase
VRPLERGTILLGKYRVDGLLGRGGMGLVVRAWHLGLEEAVAIKLLRDDVAIADETIARFIREAQAAVKLKSEHIARITDVGTFADGKPYMVMELLEGQDIGQLLVERGRLQPSLAIDLVIQACEALAEAHSLGIVHRDIKPSNLFCTSRPDGSLLLKVLDFGISKSQAGAELSLTQTWSMLGSPAYMSPEQMRSARHVDARTDVWSLGAVLYEILEGHLPFPAESFSEMCVMVAVDPPAPMVAAPPELAAIVRRCLAKQPDERFASVADLARELARLAREPDRAQVLVDRMVRMLGRGTLRRTPVAGVPLTPLAPQASGPISPQASGPIAPASGPIAPQASGPIARASGPIAPGPIAPAVVALPAGATQPLAFPVAAAPGYPVYRPAPEPVGARLPPTPVPSAMATPRRRRPLTATQMVGRADRRWLVAVVCAVLALATSIAVIGATRQAPPQLRTRPDEPPVVRMNHVPAPAELHPAASSATGTPPPATP